MINKCKLCKTCPTSKSKIAPSQYALNKIYEIQTDCNKKTYDNDQSKCDWFINSSEYGYCFWRLAEEIDSPIADREICHLECITHNQLKDIINSAIYKLKQAYDNGDKSVREFVESLIDKIKSQKQDDTVYISNEIKQAIDDHESTISDIETEREIEDSIPKKRGRRPMGMPIHRDGVKVDLYGLYSPKKLKEIRENERKYKSRKKKSATKKACEISDEA